MDEPEDVRVLDLANRLTLRFPTKIPMVRQAITGLNYHMEAAGALFGDLTKSHESYGTQWKPRIRDLPCALVPQPWNEHDENAVAVVISGRHIGFLIAEVAEQYSPRLLPLIDEGKLIGGWVELNGRIKYDRFERIYGDIFMPDWRSL